MSPDPPVPTIPDRIFRSYRAVIVAVVVAAALVAGAAGAAYATHDFTRRHEGKLLPGTKIAGVEVGGLSAEQARARVEPTLDLDREITLGWRNKEWRVTPRDLRVRHDLHEAIETASEAGRATSFFERMGMRVLGKGLGFDGEVEVVYPRRPLRRFVRQIAADLNRAPRDARIDYSNGWVEVIEDRTGRRLAAQRARRVLDQALRNGETEVDLRVRVSRPEVTADDFAQVLLLRIGENRLYLYQDGEISHSWTVATGQPGHSTPTGMFEVGTKRYMPTWYNPSPEGWGADMPLVIGPGETNPLGVRALNWSGTLIRFHGTSNLGSLGRYASRGCVRLSNDEVVQLFDLVDEGTPIVSTWAPAA